MPARVVPYRKGLTVLLALVPVLSLGLLGMVPSAVLAVDRRRPADLAGAAVIGLMQVGMFVAAAFTPKGEPIGNLTTGLLVLPLLLGTPVHFLLMNRRDQWPAARAAAKAAAHLSPYPHPHPHSYPGYPPAAPTLPAPAFPAQPAAAVQPAPAQPAPAAPTGAAELRELGELLRRQAGDGQP
ncbi:MULTISPECIES: hypothetical protein [Kitasatospora]|nr:MULTISPECIES: hypothetical protein [Kitasatospora]